MDGVHPDTINRYYGVDGEERRQLNGEMGAGHMADEDYEPGDLDSSDEDSEEDVESDNSAEKTKLQHHIARDQAHNICHKPVKVTRHHNPFKTTAAEAEFNDLLRLVVENAAIPEGFGVCPDEWQDGYPEQETIKTGLRGKGLQVTLPEAVWLP